MPGIIFTSMNRSASTSESTSFYQKFMCVTYYISLVLNNSKTVWPTNSTSLRFHGAMVSGTALFRARSKNNLQKSVKSAHALPAP